VLIVVDNPFTFHDDKYSIKGTVTEYGVLVEAAPTKIAAVL